MRRLLLPKLLAATALTAGAGAPAWAHVGDHSHMTFGELANHLASRPDHMLAIAAVALTLGAAALSVTIKRRNARARKARSPETPAT
jgi:hypothetical protein